MASLPDCYVLLGLSPYASRDDVTAAYRLLIQVWHPDRFEGQPRIRAQAEEKLKDITSAYRRIQDAGFPVSSEGSDPGGHHASRASRRHLFRCPWCHKNNRLPNEYAFESVTCGACRRHFRVDLSGTAVPVAGEEAAGDRDATPGQEPAAADHRPPRAGGPEERMPLVAACPWCKASNWVIGRRRGEPIACVSCGQAFALGDLGRAVRRPRG
jgi:hypothetical protein